jgi:hypothetical protein
MYGFGGVMYGFDRMMYGFGGSDVHFFDTPQRVIRSCLSPALRANLTKTSGPKYGILTNAQTPDTAKFVKTGRSDVRHFDMAFTAEVR